MPITDMYRGSVAGEALQIVLLKMQDQQKVSEDLCNKILEQFDETFCALVARDVKVNCNLQGRLVDFNGSESKWEFRLREVVAQLGMQPKKPLVELTSERCMSYMDEMVKEKKRRKKQPKGEARGAQAAE